MHHRHAAAAFLFLACPLLAQQGDPILQQLPHDATNLLVVRDPLPHLDAVLASPTLAELMSSTARLQRELFDAEIPVSPEQLRGLLGTVRDFVPTELVLATTPASQVALARLLRGALDVALIQMLSGHRRSNAELIEQLTATAATALATAPDLQLVAWISLRQERTAEACFDRVAEWLDDLPVGEGLEVKQGDGRLVVRLRPLQLAEGKLAGVLRDTGIAAEGLRDFTVSVALEQRGTRLSVQLGEPAAGPLPARAVQPLWQPGPARLLFAHLDWSDAVEWTSGMVDDISEALDAELREGSEVMLVQILAVLGQMHSGVVDGSVVLDVGRGISRIAVEEFDSPLDQPMVAPARLCGCVAPDDGPFLLTGAPLDALLSTVVGNITQQALERVRTEAQQLAVGRVLSRFGDVIDYLDAEDSAVFEPGSLVVTRASRFRGCGDWRPGELPLPALAIVAKADDDGAGRGFVEQLTGLFGDACEFDSRQAWADADLGLGVPTRELQLGKLVPGFAAAKLDADFRPHFLMLDAYLIVSTDVGLTKDLLERLRGPGTPAARHQLSLAQFRGDHLTACFAALGQWAEALDRHAPSQALLRAQGIDLAQVRLVMQAFAAATASTAMIESSEELEGSTYRSLERWRLR